MEKWLVLYRNIYFNLKSKKTNLYVLNLWHLEFYLI